jgi:mono/diheme cytochrome c family protein
MTRSKKIFGLIYNPPRHRRKIEIPPCPTLSKGGWGDLRTISLSLGLALLLSAVCGCDYARMNDQESVRTYKKEIPEMPPETIPITGGLQVLIRTNPKDLKNPLPYSQESVDQGKEAYSYFCVQCHGPKADGNGTVGQSFAPLPANLGSAGVQNQSDGELFSKISLGFGRHPPLASTVSDPDRWAVVNYIRSLKKGSG